MTPNTVKYSTSSFAALLITAAIASPVQALDLSLGGSFVANEGLVSAIPGATTVNFNSFLQNATIEGDRNGTATYSAFDLQKNVVAGTEDNGKHLAPSEDISPYLTLGSDQEPSPVTIQFSRPLDYFGLYWGSIDEFNSIQFFNGTRLVSEVTGTNLYQWNPSLAEKQENGVPRSHFINFFATQPNEFFNRIVLISDRQAFESDNHAYRTAGNSSNPPAIPTPALLPGLIGLAWSVLRKQRGSKSAIAHDQRSSND